MEQVIRQLDREEPDYSQAAQLGAEALPQLMALLQGEDVGLAAKAAYLAGLINASQSVDVVEMAARHPETVVRIAAAASVRNLTKLSTSLAIHLLNDSDSGVRKWVLKALEVHHPSGIKSKVEEIMTRDPDVGLRERARQIVSQLP